MNTQNTPIHIKLWHREFWLMAIASLLLTMSVYMLIPVLPLWLMQTESFSNLEAGLSVGVFGLGLYLFGAHCSWLVQHYRRNVVCLWAVTAVVFCTLLLWYVNGQRFEFAELWVILLQRFALGAAFGLAQMVLSSTLIIDTCESFNRTEANHSATWFSRLALSLGPLAGMLAYGLDAVQGFNYVALGAAGCALVALLLIKCVDFPFRTPEENVHVLSLDRFFLPHGTVLFFNLLLFSLVVGLILSRPVAIEFYALMMGGFLLALLAQRFVFRDAELKSEIVSGLILMLAAQFILLGYPESPVAPVLIGLSVGIVGSRFLLFFIKLSRHCKRGTAQSTYFLGWESGLAFGLALGYAVFYGQQNTLLIYVCMGVTTVSLLVYHLFTHAWFIRNKNR